MNEDFNPWWGDACLRDAELERAARREDKAEAEAFQAKIDASLEEAA